MLAVSILERETGGKPRIPTPAVGLGVSLVSYPKNLIQPKRYFLDQVGNLGTQTPELLGSLLAPVEIE